jgi:hypothetical protein
MQRHGNDAELAGNLRPAYPVTDHVPRLIELLGRRRTAPSRRDRTPALVAADGERASYGFFEFFTAQIRKGQFDCWYHAHGVTGITGEIRLINKQFGIYSV